MPYKDGDKWRAVVTINKKRIAQKKFDRKKDAIEWEIAQRESALAEMESKTPMDFLTFSTKYLEYCEERYGSKTFKEKVSITREFIGFLGSNMLVHEITPRHASDFLLRAKQGRSANAANKRRKNLLAMWRWGERILDLEHNPVEKMDKFPHDRSPQYTPSEDDILKVLAVTTGVDRVFLECYPQTGARRSEIFKLTWEDVNFESGIITLKTRKTRDGSTKTRTLPMTERLFKELHWWWKNRAFKNESWVFVDDHPGPHYGKPYVVRRRFLKSFCEQAGIRAFGFHALRRYVASVLSDKYKVGTPTIQKILGHENISTTDRYVQNISGDMKSALGNLGERELKAIPKRNGVSPE